MEYKIPLKWSWVIVSTTVVVLFLVIAFSPVSKKDKSTIDTTFAEQVSFGIPVRFKIPQINIDTTVEQVGLTSLGAMDVPKGPSDVAWFNLGSRPGEIGSAVIAGHSGWKDNIPAVFDNLNKIKVGNKIYVEDEKGTSITFVVKEIRIYNENADAKNVFSSNDGRSHLNLITCEGVWNEITKNHPDRLVVFADRE